VGKYLEIADIFCLATLSEGFSNVILEAMAAGLPVITTSIPANSEIIENGVNGLLIPTNDAAALSEILKYALNNPGKVREIGKNAKEYVKNNYIVSRMVKRYEEKYTRLMKRKNK